MNLVAVAHEKNNNKISHGGGTKFSMNVYNRVLERKAWKTHGLKAAELNLGNFSK